MSERAPAEIVKDAVAGYLDEVSSLRQTLATRYEELKSGRVTPIDGEAFFETLRQREDEFLKRKPR